MTRRRRTERSAEGTGKLVGGNYGHAVDQRETQRGRTCTRAHRDRLRRYSDSRRAIAGGMRSTRRGLQKEREPCNYQERLVIARAMSRASSALRASSRLSCSFLPLPSASATFARPPLK